MIKWERNFVGRYVVDNLTKFQPTISKNLGGDTILVIICLKLQKRPKMTKIGQKGEKDPLGVQNSIF